MKRRLHNAITEALSALREDGKEVIVNLEFYGIVKGRMNKNAPSSSSIALYLIRHRNEFMVRFGEKNKNHTRRNILLMSPETYHRSKKAVPKFTASMSKVV